MGTSIYNFFWWIAGANREILKQHIGDHHKYFMIGSSIMITAMLATFTGSIAFDIYMHGLNEDFHNTSIFFGLIWGLVILNMDRQIIITMKKKGTSLFEPTAYEKRQLLIQEFIIASPRFLIAIVIAMIIIEPFELLMYKDEIAFTLKKMEVDKKNETRKNTNTDNSYSQGIIQITTQLKELDVEIDRYNTQKKSFNPNKDLELSNKISKQAQICAKEGPTVSQRGSNYKKCMKILEELEEQQEEEKKFIITHKKDIKSIDKQILELNSQKGVLAKQRKDLIDKNNREMNSTRIETEEFLKKRNYESLVAQLVAKDTLLDDKSVYGEKYKNIHWILSILILLIEVLPLIAKIMSSRGAYDSEMDRIAEENAMIHDEFIRDEKLKYNKEFKNKVNNERKNR